MNMVNQNKQSKLLKKNINKNSLDDKNLGKLNIYNIIGQIRIKLSNFLNFINTYTRNIFKSFLRIKLDLPIFISMLAVLISLFPYAINFLTKKPDEAPWKNDIEKTSLEIKDNNDQIEAINLQIKEIQKQDKENETLSKLKIIENEIKNLSDKIDYNKNNLEKFSKEISKLNQKQFMDDKIKLGKEALKKHKIKPKIDNNKNQDESKENPFFTSNSFFDDLKNLFSDFITFKKITKDN